MYYISCTNPINILRCPIHSDLTIFENNEKIHVDPGKLPPMATSGDTIVLRINIPILKLQKALRVNSNDYIWMVKKQVEEKVGTEIKDVLNYGLYLHGKDGKKDKFLDERNSVVSYHLDATSQVDFCLKSRVGGETDSKKQKKIFEDIQKGNLDKVKEKTSKTTDFNFLIEGENPMSVATMNNDTDMMIWMMDNGAFLDFRVGDKDHWKTPLHLAAQHNKTSALKTLIQFGAWVDSKDTLGLSALYYACIQGNTECVLRLLLAKADTEVFDENGKGPLHVAALNNFDCIVALLLDSGANLNATNVGGNTPLHVAASRNSKESAKWLLLRGAATDKLNKSGKTPYEVALQSNCQEVADILQKFKSEQIVPPPSSRFAVDFSEVEPIVQNVLNSLSSSIGKEYTPQIFISKKTRMASMAYKKMLDGDTFETSPSRKSQHKSYLPPPPDDSYGSEGSKHSSTFIRSKGSQGSNSSIIQHDRQSIRIDSCT